MPDLAASLSAFGADVTSKTASGLGEPEEHLRAPLETLLADVAAQLKLTLVLAGEEHLADLRVRPDYAVMVGGALTGHIEVKAPGKGADPSRFRGHDRDQWSRLRSLPNVLYTDGEHWAVYRYGEPTDGRARLSGPADQVGSSLGSSTGSLLALLADFLQWQPVPPRSVKDLALQAAQLCALLRAEVRELLATEPALQAVAGEWRDLLFPDASDDQFADGYAQTVTFALLLGRVDGVDFSGGDLGAIAGHVADRHTLIGTALGILANPQLTKRFAVSLPTLVRVMAVVEWDELAKGREDRWLLFYEDFLQAYDPALRRATGSYYTPNRVVSAMTRMVDDLLRDHSRFGLGLGLADDGVRLVDPAAGSGTFLLEVFRRMADTIEADEGDAQLPARLGAALERVVGFENLIGPYAVAELRLTAELTRRGVDVGDRLRLYVADTLDDPAAAQKKMGLMYEPIARSRRAANRVKADEPVLVVLGNPPYKERSRGEGGWIEDGDEAAVEAAPLRAFFGREAPEAARAADRLIGAGPHLKHLYNLYVYFWRWATWKVFDRHEHQPNGVIAFITAAGFVQGPGFAFMRRYLRRQADDVWVIDCSPEGHQPPVSTRVFGGVQQPVCITIVSRTGRTSADQPAHVRYRTISGSQGQKFDALDAIDLRAADGWQDAADSWTAPFLPAATGGWATYAPLEELLGWSGSGTMPGRTWVVAPDRETLRRRWQRLVTAPTSEVKRELFQEHRTDRRIDLTISGELPGLPHPDRAVESEGGGAYSPPAERIGYRSFDRQWLLADKRLVNRPNPTLWGLRGPRQVYATTAHDLPHGTGAAITCAGLVPDLHHYHGRGGRAWPLWRDRDGAVANLPAGLVDALTTCLGRALGPDEVFAYVVGIAGHPGFTARFSDELAVPGVRVPLTADADLFAEVAELGRTSIWLQSFGDRMAAPEAGRPPGASGIRLPDGERPTSRQLPGFSRPGVPEAMTYDEASREIRFDDRIAVGPVSPEVVAYEVNGMNVLRKWFGYRKADPEGRTNTGLSTIHPTTWPAGHLTDLLEICNVLERIVALEPAQAALLERVLDGALIVWPEVAAGITPATKPKPVWASGTQGEL